MRRPVALRVIDEHVSILDTSRHKPLGGHTSCPWLGDGRDPHIDEEVKTCSWTWRCDVWGMPSSVRYIWESDCRATCCDASILSTGHIRGAFGRKIGASSGLFTHADARETAWKLVAAPCARTSYIMSCSHRQSCVVIRTGLIV